MRAELGLISFEYFSIAAYLARLCWCMICLIFFTTSNLLCFASWSDLCLCVGAQSWVLSPFELSSILFDSIVVPVRLRKPCPNSAVPHCWPRSRRSRPWAS